MKKKVLGITLATVLALSLGLVLAGPVGAVAPSIVSLWHFDGNANDSEGLNDGTVNGDPTWTDISGTMPGFGSALDCDGAGDYVSVPDHSTLDITGAITVEAWVYVDEMGAGEFYTVAGKWDDVGVDQRAYLLGLSRKDTALPQPKFYIASDATTWDSAVSPTNLSLDTWYHLMGTYDGSDIKLYVDCVEKDSTPFTGGIATNDAPLLIGGDQAGGTGAAFFDGMIDEVRIWNVDFPDPEVTLSPPTDANPVGADHTVTAIVDPVSPGWPINFDVTAGPNSGDTGSDTTDANGEATFTYTGDGGTSPPDDTILAYIDMDCSGTNTVGDIEAMDVTKTWVTFAAVDPLTPPLAFNLVGEEHCVYAHITPSVDGVPVHFMVIGWNFRYGVRTTEGGEAKFCYTGCIPGKDKIIAWLEVNDSWGYQPRQGDIGVEPVEKFYLTHRITGGGNITDGKGKGADKITFGGNVGLAGDDGDVGQWNINFHNVAGDEFDQGHFHSTDITYLVFKWLFLCPDADPPPDDSLFPFNWAEFKADGKFNGQPDWSIDVRVADHGEGKNAPDTIRIKLFRPGGALAYDSRWDFPTDYFCPTLEWRRHLLDGGNIQIHKVDLMP